MIRHFLLGALALTALCGATSCSEADDIIAGLDKLSYESFLCNKSGQDVTVCFRPGRHDDVRDCTYFVPKDSTVEIPDTEPWGLSQRLYESDTVRFTFADGTVVLHTYQTLNYPSDNHVYSPEVHNIFQIGRTVPAEKQAWKETRPRPKRVRQVYEIGRKE